MSQNQTEAISIHQFNHVYRGYDSLFSYLRRQSVTDTPVWNAEQNTHWGACVVWTSGLLLAVAVLLYSHTLNKWRLYRGDDLKNRELIHSDVEILHGCSPIARWTLSWPLRNPKARMASNIPAMTKHPFVQTGQECLYQLEVQCSVFCLSYGYHQTLRDPTMHKH